MNVSREWKKSGRSTNGGDCVEIRADLCAVRDTKNPDQVIRVNVPALVHAVRVGRVG